MTAMKLSITILWISIACLVVVLFSGCALPPYAQTEQTPLPAPDCYLMGQGVTAQAGGGVSAFSGDVSGRGGGWVGHGLTKCKNVNTLTQTPSSFVCHGTDAFCVEAVKQRPITVPANTVTP